MKLAAICEVLWLSAVSALAHSGGEAGNGTSTHVVVEARAVAATASLHTTKSLQDLPPLDSLTAMERTSMRSRLLCLLKKNIQLTGLRRREASEPDGPMLPKVHGSCAVVSSSGVLLRHSHGKDIDAADKVFRFNLAPTLGYSENVGYKDDLRFVNEKVLEMWNNLEHVDMLRRDITYSASCTLCDVGLRPGVGPTTFVNRVFELNRLYPEVVLYASDLKVEYVLNELIGQLYGVGPSPAGVTTGAIGMAVAMSICDEVRAYGMAETLRSDATSYHYWEPGAFTWQKNHHRSFNAEKDLWRRLASNALSEVELTDVAVIPGFSQVQCPAD